MKLTFMNLFQNLMRDSRASVGTAMAGIFGAVLIGFIIIVVGFQLIPTLVVAGNSSVTSLGATSFGGSMVPIVEGLFVIVLLGVAIGLLFLAFKGNE